MKSVSSLLAFRYLLGSTYEKNVSSMAIICFVSILIGTFSLALVTAIMHGFEVTIHEKMQGIHAQAIIRSYDDEELDEEQIMHVIAQDFPDILHASPQSNAYALIKSDETDDNHIPIVVMLKGVDPERERTVSSIEKKLLSPSSLPSVLHDNHILIGKKLAERLALKPGMPLTVFYFDEPSGRRKVKIHESHAMVGEIFDTGIDEFDSSLVICTLKFLKKILPASRISNISLTFKKDTNEEKIISALRDRLSLDVYSWKDLYPALVSALKLEKYAMFFVLMLITLVASMNIISLLFMLITQKRPDIAILRTMGMPSRAITRIFTMIGMLIVSSAAFLGLALAWLASFLLERYPFIELPDVYYVSHLPARMDWVITGTVFAAVMIISILATWIPARRTRSISVADVLRFEG